MLPRPPQLLFCHGATMRRIPLSLSSSALSPFKLSITILILTALSFAAAPQNNSGSVTLQSHRPPWALPENNRGSVPGNTMLEHLTLVLKRSPQQQKEFENFLAQLQDRSSPSYHHFLTAVQMGKRFGASLSAIDSVSAWLRSQGLRVDSVSNSRMMIDFSGTASQVGSAFATELDSYQVNGEQRIATATDPQIAPALAGVIQSVSGLHTTKNRSYHHAVPAQKLKGGGFTSPDLTICSPCENFIMPADFATIYDLNGLSVNGTGQNIGIIGRSRVYDPDVENFENLAGLAKKDPTVIIPTGGVDPGPAAGPGGTASDDQGEATLDVMRAGSIATGATVDLIVSASTQTEDGVGIAAQYAVDASPVPAQIMNISFGLCEGDVALSDVQFWDTLFSQAVGEGISVFVSAGDSGAAGCDAQFQPPPAQQSLSTNYICASSYSTCVGGTEFNDVPETTYWNENATQAPPFESALGPIPEGAWNEPFNIDGSGATWVAGGGGGFSVFIPTPTWQTGTGVPGNEGRYTPDVAFSASGHDGYLGCLAAGGGDCVVQNGGFNFEFFFGTSAAAPDMAGITALLNQKTGSAQGELNQRLYELATTPANLVFNDVTVATSGVSPCVVTSASMCNNSTAGPTGVTGGQAGYLVTAGYDEATGLGSINGANLLSSWAAAGSSPTTTTVVSSLNPAAYGASVTFTATVAFTGTNSPPTGTVTFFNGTLNLGFGTLNGSQVATFTTSTLAPGSDSITAVYSGDTNYAASTSSILTQTITAPTFTVTNTGGTTDTVLAGVPATVYAFTVAPVAPAPNFGATVTFSCSFSPADPTLTNSSCVFNPATISASSTGTVPVTLTITTTGPNMPGLAGRQRRADNRSPWLPLTLPLAGIVMAGFAGRKVWKHSAAVGLCLSLILLGLLIACGGSSTPPIVVSVSGAPTSVFPNNTGWTPVQTAQFTATVTNTSNTAVTWAVTTPNGGSIDQNGLYTAPTVAAGLPTAVTITATSQADSTKSASASETLKPATIPGTYAVTVTVTDTAANPQTQTLPVTLIVQ